VSEPAKPDTAGTEPAPYALLLLVSVFVIGTCGLVYELLASTIASYLIGDSVTQFSTVIGAYLFAMGFGSWCSRYVVRDALGTFVRVEIMIALIGGWSAASLFMLFPVVEHFRIILYALVLLIGALVGLEIPLLMRVLRARYAFNEMVSNVLTFDYVGALVASIAFPLILMPLLGLVRTGFMFGIFNVLVAIGLIWKIGGGLAREKVVALLTLATLVIGFAYANQLQRWSETLSYGEKVIYAVSTPYQRIMVARNGDDVRLFLNGNLQFSSRDEYRYHESLVHPAMGRVAAPANVLIMGGGDGLAAREVLRYPAVKHLTLVDLDPAVTQLFSHNQMLRSLNNGSFFDPRMKVINADAFRWIRAAHDQYDVVIVDFPDPVDFAVGKLYTDSFYHELNRILAPQGVAVVQSTSPFVAPRAFWTVASTLEAAGLQTRGYHVYVPSFGEWGFMLAAHHAISDDAHIIAGNRFLSPETAPRLFDFPPDMARRPTPVNRLDNQILVREFADEWSKYEG